MRIRIIAMGVAAVGVMAIGLFMIVSSVQQMTADTQFVESFPTATSTESNNASEAMLPPEQIVTQTGTMISAAPIVESPSSEVLADGFYALTDDKSMYDIFYNEPTGVLFISLYKEPVGYSRALAERKLLEILPLSKEEICAIEVNVTTNGYVNESLSGINLGLSFCPGSVQLP